MTSGPHDLTAPQAAEIVGCHPQTISRWAADGEIPALRTPSGRYRFNRAELDAWLQSRRVKAS
jgi:excisionase family DNA binding protein